MFLKRKEKKKVAREALFFIKDRMTIGIGAGSTVRIFIKLLARKVKKERLKIKVVPCTSVIEKICRKRGLRVIKGKNVKIDIALDGADKIDNDFNVTKGFGAFSFVEEKKIDYKADRCILIADSRKFVDDVLDYPILIKSDEEPKADFVNEIKMVKNGFYKILVNKKKVKSIGELESKLEKIGGSGLFSKFKKLLIIGVDEGTVFVKPKQKFLQVAVDIADKKKALNLIKKVEKYVDIIEIGTPLIKSSGVGVIKMLKTDKLVMADFKTADTGSYEVEIGMKKGADIISILGGSSDNTIVTAVQSARKFGKKVLVDLIDVRKERRVSRLKEILSLKELPSIVCVHIAIDAKDKKFYNLEKIVKLCKEKKVGIALAGGIDKKKMKKLLKFEPDIIIVGGAITKSKNPVRVVKELNKILNNY